MKKDKTKNTVYGVIIINNMALTLEKLNAFFHIKKKMTLKQFMDIQQSCWEETKKKYNLKIEKEKT